MAVYGQKQIFEDYLRRTLEDFVLALPAFPASGCHTTHKQNQFMQNLAASTYKNTQKSEVGHQIILLNVPDQISQKVIPFDAWAMDGTLSAICFKFLNFELNFPKRFLSSLLLCTKIPLISSFFDGRLV
jgi:hypothetical protein